MTDSSSFSSLLALVDSHLSKTNIQESRSEDAGSVSNSFPMPLMNQLGTLSDSKLSFPPGQRLPIPTFKFDDNTTSPIQNVLAEQVANMLKAKELKKQKEEEEKRLAEEMKKIKLAEDDCIIDLMQALQTPYHPAPPIKEEALSSSSSFESLFQPKFIDCDDPEENKSPEPLLPCKQDMSYILFQKVRKAKCSPFGKVLCAKLRPVAYPYLRQKIESTIKPFDFSTPSPCDIIKEKLRKPTSYCAHQPMDIFSIFG